MSKIVFDEVGKKKYETGVSQTVLYNKNEYGNYDKATPWNGITSIAEKPSGAEPTPLYADNIKYLNLLSAEDFNFSISAYTYPEEFEECDGSKYIAEGVKISQQNRKRFGLSYKTNIGNDTNGNDHGYKLHLVYNALASVSERTYNTINDSPEAIQFAWECSTDPVFVSDRMRSSHLVVDGTKVDAKKLELLETILYGGELPPDSIVRLPGPRLPMPEEVMIIILGGTMSSNNRNYFRGKNLGTNITSKQLEAIRNGTFDDLFIGDYWECTDYSSGLLNRYRIADIDYYLSTGQSEFMDLISGNVVENQCKHRHHLVIVPDRIEWFGQTDSSTAGPLGDVCSIGMPNSRSYAQSNIRTSEGALNIYVNGEGSDHNYRVLPDSFKNNILSFNERLSLTYDTSMRLASTGSCLCYCELMSHNMIYGANEIRLTSGYHYEHEQQLSLFKMMPEYIYNTLSALPEEDINSGNYITRTMMSSSNSKLVFGVSKRLGRCTQAYANDAHYYGLRPYFCVG